MSFIKSLLSRDKSVSLESHIMTLLGSALYGTPASNGLPHDFFYRIEDRDMPQPGEGGFSVAQKNIYVNLTRARLAMIERRIGFVLGIAMLVMLWFVGSNVAQLLRGVM